MSTSATSPLSQRKAGVPPMNPSAWGSPDSAAPRTTQQQQQQQPPQQAPPLQPAPTIMSSPGSEDAGNALNGPPTFGFAPPSLDSSQLHAPPPSVSHEEFLHTYTMIQYVAQPALVTVLRALLDENPWLTTQIRLMCDQAMQQLITLAGQAQQQQQQPHHASGGLSSNAGPFQPQQHHHQQHHHHQHNHGGGVGSYAAATPPSSARKASGPRRGGNGREDESDVCAVHGNWRSVKHLQYNASTRQVECIPGFHCLDNGGGSNLPTPTKRPLVSGAGQGDLPPMAPTLLQSGIHTGSIPPSPHKIVTNPTPRATSSRGPTPPPAPFLPPHTPPPPEQSAVVASPTDPDETRRLEALLNELHKTTES